MHDPSESRPAVRKSLALFVALLSMIGPFSIDAYLPSFPDIETAFGIDRATLSQSLAAYLATFAVSTLIWGPLSDRFGRRMVILISMSLYILASIGCALSVSITMFVALRGVQGVAASGGFITGRAMIRDAHDRRSAHRAMSHVTLVFALAPAVAPVLGGWLNDAWGWRSVFWFLCLFAGMLLVMTMNINETLAVENRQSLHPQTVSRVYLQILKHPRFPLLMLTLSLSFAGIFLYIAGAPTVIYDFLGLGERDFGVQFIPMVAGLMSGSFVSGRLSHRWAPEQTVAAGFGVIVLAVALNIMQAVLLDTSVPTVIGPLVAYAFGVAMIMPAITIMALDCFPHHRGTAASMLGFSHMLINAAVASIAVPLLHTREGDFVAGQAVFIGLAILMWFISLKRK